MLLRTGHSTLCGARTGWLSDHLFRPGGLRDAIPTKTPVFPHQFRTSCRLSLRQPSHVLRTVLASMAFFLKILVFVRTLSIRSRELTTWSHLLCISCVVCILVRSLLHLIVLSHLIFHIMYMDSDTMILKSQLFPVSGSPLSFLKFTRQHPRRAP